ncbi:hypothetical protein J4E00_03615 [Siccationidurans soli]|uniref:Uncharacterized protein n=1 Tax=Hymenobacter negativus TaxID=2795026 RepID=A0ABS3QAY7_9BACT|nr:hypothetical protein [Hymenobacter negativus]
MQLELAALVAEPNGVQARTPAKEEPPVFLLALFFDSLGAGFDFGSSEAAAWHVGGGLGYSRHSGNKWKRVGIHG